MSHRLLVASIIAACTFRSYADAKLPAALIASRTLEAFRTPLARAQTAERRVATAAGVIWFITPDAHVRRYTKTLSHETDLSLPPGLREARAGSLAIAAVDRNSAWIIDREAESLWHIDHGKWSGPLHAGEPIGGAAARADGCVIINTPAHSKHAFSVVSPSGEIILRFGERLHAPSVALDRYENSWVISTTSAGDVVAAHSFRPLLRRYDTSGTLVWEKRIALSSLRAFDDARVAAEASIRSNPETCCVEAKLIRYASDVLIGDDEVMVRFGFNAILEVFAYDGTWQRTIGVSVPTQPLGWPVAGLALAGDRIAACELSRLVLYEPPRTAGMFRGTVVDHEDKTIAGARVVVQAGNGALVTLTTAEDGAFQIRGFSKEVAARIDVTAEGFLNTTRNGLLQQILASPIRLEREPRQCVFVTDEAARPVRRFHLQVGRLATGADTVTRGGGRSREFASEDGHGCLDTPVRPPLYVRVSADGYATREVTVSEPGTANVRLSPEARVRALIRSDAQEPVAGARLYVESASAEKRVSFAIPQEMTVTTGEDGIGLIKGLGADTYRLVVEHPSFLYFEKNVSIDKGANDVDVTLDRGTEVTVRVTFAGQRVPDTVVRAEGQGQNLSHTLKCTTGADGTGTIEAVAPGRYLMRAEASGFSRGQQTLVVAPGQRTASVDIALSKGVTVTGHVRGIDLYPGTQLDLLMGKPGVPTITAPISGTGEFRINEAPSGQVNLWVAEHGVNSTLLYRSLQVPEAPQYDLTIELPAPLTLRGRITSGAIGCGSCLLTLQLLGSEMGRPLRNAEVQADGLFVVRLPSGGSYRAAANDPLSGASLLRTLEIAQDMNADFNLGGSSLRVTVVAANGSPTPAALVDVASSAGTVATSTTDDAGVALFSALSAGHYRVTASRKGRAVSREIDVDGPSAIEVRIPDSTPLQLRVVDAVSGLPVPMISARVISARGETAAPANVIGEGGVFVLPSFAAQPLTVVVSARGYGLKTLPRVAASDTPTTVLLSPGGRSFSVEIASDIQPCGFEIRDATGSAIALSLESNPGPVPLFVRNAVFYNLEPGSYTVFLYDCQGKAVSQPMRLAPGITPALHFP